MLVLSRRLHQTIIISDPDAPGGVIEVTVIGINDDQVRFSLRAPREVAVRRSETEHTAGKKASRWRTAGPPGI